MWWKKHKWKLIVPVLIAAVLAISFWYGGSAPGLHGWTVEPETLGQTTDSSGVPAGTPEQMPKASDSASAQETAPSSKPEKTDRGPASGTGASAESPAKPATSINPETGKDQYLTDPVPEGKPAPEEPQNAVIDATADTCTLSISCATILDNLDACDPEKVELVPENGWILEPVTVSFYEGESVFNVLQRTCKQQGIHMEYENTPLYNSAYIEGIHNLYEFDVGQLSGWMYKVNGWFPNYGCSRCQLQDGDVVEWVYTCDQGYDVGGGYAAAGNQT